MTRVIKKRKKATNQRLSRKIKRAVVRSYEFHGAPPRNLKVVNIKIHPVLVHIGGCMQLNYLSDKFDGEEREYYHRFGPGCKVFAFDRPQPDGSEILIIKGKFKIKPVGLTG